MLAMDEHDIRAARLRYHKHHILGRATEFLEAFMQEVNDHSDGWAYWPAPVKAAKKLMEIIQDPPYANENTLKKAITPIRSFYTRRGYMVGMGFPENIL
jgi:23S rRNA A2030 N6-methylase RlmJ